jgi:hypothetical protein
MSPFHFRDTRVRARLLPMCLAVALVVGMVVPLRASAVERNFAGSVQLDYHLVPSQPSVNARPIGFDGFTTEAALKVSADISEHISANVKVCYGCHGFEMNMAYIDLRVADEFNVRVGRFSPSFGSFNLRHDPANHRLSDKPLAYDMGRMLRLRTWNMGVLPSPFPDNGIELNGNHWFGEDVEIDYAAYAVSGFKGDANGFDLDFQQSRSGSLYYVDNNARPTIGARVALTAKLGGTSDMTVGASGMYGWFDPNNLLSYAIVGADLVFRFERTNLRFEYLARRQEFDISDLSRFAYAVTPNNGNFFLKHGAYAEVEQPLSKTVDLVGRVDWLHRAGNVLREVGLARSSSVFRYTFGTTFAVERGFRVKGSTELWQWTDRDASGNKLDVGFHLAVVGSF